ncbi:hypothetical protein QRD43_03860 [Pelomonas sp. APW6]|uniref:Response regulatory domain-containing protein n=1 Tax=Roseateles subflavus TaxID=3053353 RepID=A0ABT7LDV6_9BURK|nr:hypothetical protein [Pelomonas sp. APW6]MDL5031033.1 hypothetical protein [Pelomonas sp. APW6]
MSSVFLLRHSQRSLQRAALDLADTGWQCLGTSQHWQEAAASLRHAMPAYLVSDLHLSDGHASCLLQQLSALPPGVVRPRVLLISDAVDELTLFPTLSSGGHAYHLDQPRGPSLQDSLQALEQGRARMSPAIAREALHSFGAPRRPVSEARRLEAGLDRQPLAMLSLISRAEQALLSLLSHGLLVEEIADAWYVLREEVERRIARLYRKLHALCPPAHVMAGGDRCLLPA